MKKIMKTVPGFLAVLCLAALLFYPGNAFAETSGSCGDGLSWVLSDDGILQISGSGSLTGSSWNNADVLQASIPEGVTSIAEDVFLDCSNMTGFTVAPSNQYYASENGVLFNKDKTVLIIFPKGKSGDYTIPGSVKTILTGAFAFCSKLTSVTMPDSITSLGKYAFNCCSGLTTAVISKGVAVIPQDCFSNCSALTSVSIPEGVTKIEASAFWGCSSLAEVNLPNSLGTGSIAEDAFEGCPLDKGTEEAVSSRLYHQEAPSSSGEYSLKVGETKDYQLSPTIGGTFLEGRFYAESSDESVVTIASLTRNGSINYADGATYYYVLGVTGVGPGKADVTVYADNTKKKVLSKTTFTVTGEAANTSGKTDAGKETFATGFTLAAGEEKECKGESTLGGSLIESPFTAESSDKNVMEIVSIARGGNVNYADGITYFYTVKVKGVGPGKAKLTVYADKTKTKVIGSTTITVTGDAPAKTGDTSAKAGDASANAKEETQKGTSGQKAVKTVTSGGGVYEISGSAAVLTKPKNKNITKLTVPAAVSLNGKKYKVTSVDAKACKGLKKLKTVIIGQNVTAIKKNAFYGCTKLTDLTIGKNVKSIGRSAFQGCKNLKTITFKTAKLTSKSVGAKAFRGTPAKAKVKVPKKKLKAYKKWLFSKGISRKAKIK